MLQALTDELASVATSGEHPLDRAVAILRLAYPMDRVSLARVDPERGRFEIVAAAGAELLAPGCELPVATCTYFLRTAAGEQFAEPDFARSRDFGCPLDGIVEAAGFRAGGSAPIRAGGVVVGAVSYSSMAAVPSMRTVIEDVTRIASVLAPAFEAREHEQPRLSPRERDLLVALEEGLRFKQIALRLEISEATAKTHGRHLFRKLGVTSRGEAVHEARSLGLLA